MTLLNHPRLHPWLPLLRDSAGNLRLRPDLRSPALPRDLSDSVAAAARRLSAPQAVAGMALGPGARALAEAGLLVDGDELAETRAVGGEAAVRAHLSRHALDPARARRVRNRCDISVALRGPDPLTQPLQVALESCGITVAATGRQARSRRPVIAVDIGRPGPTRIHHWMQEGTIHLPVVPRPASVRVGPLVVPGRTSCLQCLHLARTDQDRDWPLLSDRWCRSPTPHPDPLLMLHAAALVAHAVIEFAETSECSASDAYWVAALDEPATSRVPVARHPLCGCWWPQMG